LRGAIASIGDDPHDGGAENAGVENAGVENAGAITYGKSSEEKTKIPVYMLKRNALRPSVNAAHEQRPGVHIQALYGLTV